MNNGGIGHVLSLCELRRYLCHESLSFSASSIIWCKHKAAEGTVLDFYYTLVVHTFLFILATLKGCVEFLVQVAFCEWVERPYIKECLLPLLPEIASTDIQSSFIGRVGTAA